MKFMSNFKSYYLVYGIFNKFLVKIRSLTTLTERKKKQMNPELLNSNQITQCSLCIHGKKLICGFLVATLTPTF